MREKTYSTDELVKTMNFLYQIGSPRNWIGWPDNYPSHLENYKKIITRLRAADALCEAAKEELPENRGIFFDRFPRIRKAIADYEVAK